MIVSYRSFHSGLLAKISRTFHFRDQCFHVVLALDRGLNRFVMFEEDQAFDRISLRKSRHQPIPMLVNSPHKVVRHPDIEDAVRCARQDVYIAAQHAWMVKGVDARHKAGHDEKIEAADVRSGYLTIFWHCGQWQNSSRTGPERDPGNEPSTVLAEI